MAWPRISGDPLSFRSMWFFTCLHSSMMTPGRGAACCFEHRGYVVLRTGAGLAGKGALVQGPKTPGSDGCQDPPLKGS